MHHVLPPDGRSSLLHYLSWKSWVNSRRYLSRFKTTASGTAKAFKSLIDWRSFLPEKRPESNSSFWPSNDRVKSMKSLLEAGASVFADTPTPLVVATMGLAVVTHPTGAPLCCSCTILNA